MKENRINYYGFKNVQPIGLTSLKVSSEKMNELLKSLYYDSFEVVKKKRDFSYIIISFDKKVRYLKYHTPSLKKLLNMIQEHKS